MRIQYNGKSKILIRLAELVNQKADAEDLEQTAADLQKEIDEKADKSAIPTVGDGVLSVQRNGKSVGTFSANAAKDTAVNIPVPEKVSELENDAGYGTYTKPAAGIPKSDLASGVQESLDKADTALQKHQDISGKLNKTGDASNTTVAFSAASARENVKTGEKLSAIVGKIAKWFADLKTVAFTGSYNDLSNKPTIPDGSKYLPLSGGVMTGDIDMYANKKEVLIGSASATSNKTTPVGGAYLEIANSMSNAFPSLRSFVGSYHNTLNDKKYNVISVRHRNGYTVSEANGNAYGILLFTDLESASNISWNQQIGVGKWVGNKVLLDSANFKSYALAKDATANAAKTLTDSGWTATTKDTTFAATSTVKCRKYGQLVEVRGEVTFNNTYGSPTVCTLPAGYRPATVVRACGYTPNGKLFGINIDTAGVVSLPSDSAGTFVQNTTYHIDLTYLLG